ncbi:MAG: OmpA family protein [Acidobacteria bacterium]|nr:OmpA family protein [Acidobacteriota bacterium]
MRQFNRTKIAVLAGVALVILAGTGCATKKFVRQQVDLNEKALGADKKAEQAGQSAQQANRAAQEANQVALNARGRADEVGANAERRFEGADREIKNIDNFQQLSTETILFGFNQSVLTPDAKSKLDQMVSTLESQNRYVVEVKGFTDRSGDSSYNLGLSGKRADEVVRYLTLRHNVPLRRIHVLGAGEVEGDQQAKGRAAREMARRVDVKVYGPSMPAAALPNGTNQVSRQ